MAAMEPAADQGPRWAACKESIPTKEFVAAVNSMPLTDAEKEDAYTQQLEADFEHTMNEIDARKQFLDDMLRDHGEREHKKHEAEILAQISDLVREAKKLDKKLKERSSR